MTLDRDQIAVYRDLLAAAEEAVRLRDAVDRVTALCDRLDPDHDGGEVIPVTWLRAALGEDR